MKNMDKGVREMNELVVALITIFGTVASVSGVVIYVFNGTRTLIREMHGVIREIHTAIYEMQKQAEQRHNEIIATLNQQHQDMIQQHQDMIELLKRGFGIAST